MSTFAVFGMTRDVVLAEAKKRTKGTRKNVKAPGGVEPVPLTEWWSWLRRRQSRLWGGVRFGSYRRCSMPRSTPSSSLRWPEKPFNAGICGSGPSAL